MYIPDNVLLPILFSLVLLLAEGLYQGHFQTEEKGCLNPPLFFAIFSETEKARTIHKDGTGHKTERLHNDC